MEMRRADRALTGTDTLSEVLAACPIGHLGLVDAEGVYVVPLNFAHRLTGDQVTVYVHGAGAGRKLAAIRAQPQARICFQAETHQGTTGLDDPQVCHLGTAFRSVIGWGRARVVTDPAEARAGLSLLTEKYAPGRGAELPADLGFVTILAFDLDELTGKARQV